MLIKLNFINMHLATELCPSPEVAEAQYDYSLQHSTPIAEHIDKHCEESTKWAEENDAEVIMMVHPLEVCYCFCSKVIIDGITS